MTTVALRLILSPNHPNINAPKGLNTKVEQNANAERIDAVSGSVLGKNNSLSNTAM
jgi:hypothetical protein